jgi:hypothetical protein
MIRSDDIEDAVSRGIITRPQAEQLFQIAATRHKARSFAVGSEERFRLLGGFNDFFIAVGVVLVGIGLFRAGPNSHDQGGLWWLFCAAISWMLAEVLTKRQRLTAPSIVLSCLWIGFVSATISSMTLNAGGSKGAVAAAPSLAALSAILVHYFRFRLPFSLLLIALSGWALTLAIAAAVAKQSFGISANEAFRMTRWVSLIYGLGIFALAINFDRRDPERLTRKADNGFWLHMVAAPLIVHPIAAPLINHPLFSGGGNLGSNITGGTVALVFVLTAILALVAIIVDRRALLVAGLGYLGGAMIFALSQLTGKGSSPAILTLLILGSAIIVLGVGWRSVRRTVMTILPDGTWKRGLPPYGGITTAGA